MSVSKFIKLGLAVAMIFSASQVINATPLNITQYDGFSSSATGWKGMQEDNEVEPGSLNGQIWDYEAFVVDNGVLSMVGGINFELGATTYKGHNYQMGDIFIDVDGDWQDNVGNDVTCYGYEYVIDMDYDNNSYLVYGIDDAGDLIDVFERRGPAPPNTGYPNSDPWRHSGTGNALMVDGVHEGGSFSVSSVKSGVDAANLVGLSGAFNGTGGSTSSVEHYVLSDIDISWVYPLLNGEGYLHTTLSCGNDNMKGLLPEPNSLSLVGLGLICLVGYGFSRRKK